MPQYGTNRASWGAATASLDVSLSKGRQAHWRSIQMQCWHTALENIVLCRCKHPTSICQLWEAGHGNQASYLIQLNVIFPITTGCLYTFLKYRHATSKRKATVYDFGCFGGYFFPLQLKKIIVISGVKTVICQLNQLITLIHLKKLNPLNNFTEEKKKKHML